MDLSVWYNDAAMLAKLASATGILPDHYFLLRSRLATQSSEIALQCAVLEDAVDCFQLQFESRGRRAKRLSQRSWKWFFADEPEWIFSFVHICATLGLDPEQIRRRLIARYTLNETDSPELFGVSGDIQ
jgi:hypothetical protein